MHDASAVVITGIHMNRRFRMLMIKKILTFDDSRQMFKRTIELSFLVTFAHKSESSIQFRSRERKFHGIFAPMLLVSVL